MRRQEAYRQSFPAWRDADSASGSPQAPDSPFSGRGIFFIASPLGEGSISLDSSGAFCKVFLTFLLFPIRKTYGTLAFGRPERKTRFVVGVSPSINMSTNRPPPVRGMRPTRDKPASTPTNRRGREMTLAPWPTPNWPEGVPQEITDYDIPLFNLLDEAAQNYPNQTYTIFNDAPRTFAQVKDTADRIANFLHAKGIRKGDRVAIFLPNLPHYPAIYFGILKAGAVCVTCNPLYTPTELNYQLKDAGAKALFCMDHPQFYATTEKAVQGTDVETVVICNIKSYLPWIKGFLGGLLGKIPQAEKHAPGPLDVRRCRP
jgi:hypothetical protein